MASISGTVRGPTGEGTAAGTTIVTVWGGAAGCVIQCGGGEGVSGTLLILSLPHRFSWRHRYGVTLRLLGRPAHVGIL